jgi:lipopolysaccharide/colanic/teichoic acid biosynthesis glycosyltransferase
LARLARAAGAQTVEQLGPLHQYLGLNAAVRRGLQDRTQALLTAHTLQAEARSKAQSLNKMQEHKTRVIIIIIMIIIIIIMIIIIMIIIIIINMLTVTGPSVNRAHQ